MDHLCEQFKALSDPGRLRVVAALLAHAELCGCHLGEMLGFSAPTISRHMGILLRAGLVESRRDGRWVHYRLAASMPAMLRDQIAESAADSEIVATDLQTLSACLSTADGGCC